MTSSLWRLFHAGKPAQQSAPQRFWYLRYGLGSKDTKISKQHSTTLKGSFILQGYGWTHQPGPGRILSNSNRLRLTKASCKNNIKQHRGGCREPDAKELQPHPLAGSDQSNARMRSEVAHTQVLFHVEEMSSTRKIMT
mmetsp:Transcript_36900/g.60473  ORF Transcript_36900/g.60473 Transcript_36900/m.60473 type:complete len:138 (-) Transcript_36900:66-479(-)